MIRKTKAELLRHRKNGAATTKGRSARYTIEGELLSVIDIARRLGITLTGLRKRFAKALASGNPVTWEALGGVPS